MTANLLDYYRDIRDCDLWKPKMTDAAIKEWMDRSNAFNYFFARYYGTNRPDNEMEEWLLLHRMRGG